MNASDRWKIKKKESESTLTEKTPRVFYEKIFTYFEIKKVCKASVLIFIAVIKTCKKFRNIDCGIGETVNKKNKPKLESPRQTKEPTKLSSTEYLRAQVLLRN